MIVYTEPPKKPKDEDIFIDDVNELVRKSFPDHEGQHPLFKKFGVRFAGICDTWLYTKDWEELPEIDKWKYVAFCALYWKEQYKYWNAEMEYKEYKNFVREESKHNPDLLITLKRLEDMEKNI